MELVRPPYATSILTICLLSCALSAGAQQQATQTTVPGNSFEGHTVASIAFDPVAQPLENSDLDRLIPFRVGQPFYLAETHDAIEKLYSTGRYEDIQVDLEPAASGEVDVRFITTNSWFFGHVEIDGDVSRTADHRTNSEHRRYWPWPAF